MLINKLEQNNSLTILNSYATLFWKSLYLYLYQFINSAIYQWTIGIISRIIINQVLINPINYMFARINFQFRSFFRAYSQEFTCNFKRNPFILGNNLRKPLLASALYAFVPANVQLKEEEKVSSVIIQETVKEEAVLPKRLSIFGKIWNVFIHVIRFFHLMFIFAPPILLFPLMLFKSTEGYWMDLFVKAVQRSGVVFIKAFQYLSHRRDIIGPELASKFEYLREKAPTHSLETTKEYFRQSYGKSIDEIFEQFETQPIASGSVSQVYRAMYKGKKVAVKVRHPGVDKYIERDINILFFISYLASFLSASYEIPISYSSLKKTLIEQIDFTFEMKNLNTFREMFKERKDVKFPRPIQENTKEMVLIETFVEGQPVTYFELNKHPLNKVIAKLGSEAFFEMLMKNNFIHADCHGGNIFIEVKDQSYNFFTQIRDFFKDLAYVLSYRLKAETVDSESLKKLYLQYCQSQLAVRALMRKEKEKIIINLLDAGMVIRLEERDKKIFVNFIKAVIQCKGNECANMIYNLSNYEGKKLAGKNFENYRKELEEVFGMLNGKSYSQLQGMTLFHNMLTTIRKNKMKLDGQFATLLTNIIVLQGIARDIDPEINILKCAFPYFKYVEEYKSVELI